MSEITSAAAVSSHAAASRAAIARAAQATGVDFDYLLAQAKLESGLDPNARAATSSATGLYQFLGGPAIVLPTEVPVTVGDSRGGLAGDGKGPIWVSLDSPHIVVAPANVAYPEGRLQVDRLGTSHLAPLVTMVGGQRQLNPDLAANHIAVLKDTHGRTSQLSAADVDAVEMYLRSLQK